MNQFHFQSRVVWTGLSLLLAVLAVVATAAAAEPDRLIVYSGRAERLIKPVLDAFQANTGIQVDLLSSGTTELVNRLQTEGARTQADVFLTNDAGSLERARELHLLQPLTLPDVERAIPAIYRASDNSWIGLSGRLWVVVYNKNLAKPSDVRSLLELADPKWKDKIAIPNAGSEYLQAGVSVLKAAYGDDRVRQFLQGLKANAGTQVYGKSSQIVEAVAKGQAVLGIVNHYYIYRHLATQSGAPIALLVTDQQAGGMGVILNVSGIGVTAHAKHLEPAKRLIAFLASEAGQKQFAELNKEYPLRPDVAADPALPDRTRLRTAAVPLAKLSELREPAMTLIEQAGLR